MHGRRALACDVLVVGAGPTGLTLANVLGQLGVRTILVDRKSSTVAEPRAVSIDDESLRTMQAIGLADEVLADVVPGYGVHYWTRPGGKCFGKVEPTASEYGFPRRNAFRQPLFEATLRNGLRRFEAVTVLFEHTLVDFSQDATGVTANVATPDGMIMVHAAYLVGTDGGRSSVRQAIGSTLVGSSFKARWLVVDLDGDDDDFWQTRAWCDPARPVVEVPGPHRTRRFEFLLKPEETDEQMLQPERVRELLRPFKEGKEVSIVRKIIYTFHARVADRWRQGRVFIAGDAAHLTPPYAGQGMNSGVRDAHNLGWKLAGVLRGMIGAQALDSYELERRDHAWSMIRLALSLGFVMAPSGRLRAWAIWSFFRATALVPPVRDYFLQMKFKPRPRFRSGLIDDEPGGCSSLVGSMLPQPVVTMQHGQGVLDQLIGHRFALLAVDVNTDDLRLLGEQTLWAQLNAARVALVCGDGGSLPGTAEAGFSMARIPDMMSSGFWSAARGHVLLVRPDRYIAGVFEPANAKPFAQRFARRIGVTVDAAFGPKDETSHVGAAIRVPD